jgi:hypothetical protein
VSCSPRAGADLRVSLGQASKQDPGQAVRWTRSTGPSNCRGFEESLNSQQAGSGECDRSIECLELEGRVKQSSCRVQIAMLKFDIESVVQSSDV